MERLYRRASDYVQILRTRGIVGIVRRLHLAVLWRWRMFRLKVPIPPATPAVTIIAALTGRPSTFALRRTLATFSRPIPDWEFCVCAEISISPRIRKLLSGYRGRSPRVKIICSPQALDVAGVIRLAVEFATGEFVALWQPRHSIGARTARSVARAMSKGSGPDMFCLTKYTRKRVPCPTVGDLDSLLSLLPSYALVFVRKSIFLTYIPIRKTDQPPGMRRSCDEMAACRNMRLTT
jgi:hypothetical protein